jgi:hypothetical protein
MVLEGQPPAVLRKVLCQVNASSKSVNKDAVRDIRDTLEYHSATSTHRLWYTALQIGQVLSTDEGAEEPMWLLRPFVPAASDVRGRQSQQGEV